MDMALISEGFIKSFNDEMKSIEKKHDGNRERVKKRLIELINPATRRTYMQIGDRNVMDEEVDIEDIFSMIQSYFGRLEGELESTKKSLNEQTKENDNYRMEIETLRTRLCNLIKTAGRGTYIQVGNNNDININNGQLCTLVENRFCRLEGELKSAKVTLEKVYQNMETLQVKDGKDTEVLTTIRREVRCMLESGVVPTFRSLFDIISKFIGNQKLETFQLSDMDQRDQTLINIIAKRYGMVDIDQLRQILEVPITVVETALANDDKKEFFCKVLFWILKEDKSQEDAIATFKEFYSRMPEKKKNTPTCVAADNNSSLSMEHTDIISHESSIDLTTQSNSVISKKLDAINAILQNMASQEQLKPSHPTMMDEADTGAVEMFSMLKMNLREQNVLKEYETSQKTYSESREMENQKMPKEHEKRLKLKPRHLSLTDEADGGPVKICSMWKGFLDLEKMEIDERKHTY